MKIDIEGTRYSAIVSYKPYDRTNRESWSYRIVLVDTDTGLQVIEIESSDTLNNVLDAALDRLKDHLVRA